MYMYVCEIVQPWYLFEGESGGFEEKHEAMC